jgi:phage FluMu gp28-like protein
MNITLHPGQKRIWNEIQTDHNKGVRHFTVVCPRQFGKTYLFQALVIYWGTRKDKYPMLWISQYLANARLIMNSIVDLIQDEPFYRSSNKQDMKITFKNGTVINFRGADNPKGIRGLSNRVVFLDEVAHFSSLGDTINKIVRPTTLAFKDAQMYLISTPNGRNEFYEMALKGKSEEYPTYGFYSGTYLESPYVDMEEIENAKKELSAAIWAQEYNAEFLDVNLGVFRNIEMCSTLMEWIPPVYGVRFHCGIDWGRRNDSTVVTILDDNMRVCYIWRSEPGMSWDEQVIKVMDILKRYRVFHVFAESNAAGDILVDTIKKMFPRIDGFFMTNDRKNDLVENLKYALEKRTILLPHKTLYDRLDNELNSFTFKLTPQGNKMKYTAPEHLHDDHVISLCLALQSVRKHSTLGNYTFG